MHTQKQSGGKKAQSDKSQAVIETCRTKVDHLTRLVRTKKGGANVANELYHAKLRLQQAIERASGQEAKRVQSIREHQCRLRRIESKKRDFLHKMYHRAHEMAKLLEQWRLQSLLAACAIFAYGKSTAVLRRLCAGSWYAHQEPTSRCSHTLFFRATGTQTGPSRLLAILDEQADNKPASTHETEDMGRQRPLTDAREEDGVYTVETTSYGEVTLTESYSRQSMRIYAAMLPCIDAYCRSYSTEVQTVVCDGKSLPRPDSPRNTKLQSFEGARPTLGGVFATRSAPVSSDTPNTRAAAAGTREHLCRPISETVYDHTRIADALCDALESDGVHALMGGFEHKLIEAHETMDIQALRDVSVHPDRCPCFLCKHDSRKMPTVRPYPMQRIYRFLARSMLAPTLSHEGHSSQGHPFSAYLQHIEDTSVGILHTLEQVQFEAKVVDFSRALCEVMESMARNGGECTSNLSTHDLAPLNEYVQQTLRTPT